MTESHINKQSADLLEGMTDLERIYVEDKDRFISDVSAVAMREIDTSPFRTDVGMKLREEFTWNECFHVTVSHSAGLDGDVYFPHPKYVNDLKRKSYGRAYFDIDWGDFRLDDPKQIEIEKINVSIKDISWKSPSNAFHSWQREDARSREVVN